MVVHGVKICNVYLVKLVETRFAEALFAHAATYVLCKALQNEATEIVNALYRLDALVGQHCRCPFGQLAHHTAKMM